MQRNQSPEIYDLPAHVSYRWIDRHHSGVRFGRVPITRQAAGWEVTDEVCILCVSTHFTKVLMVSISENVGCWFVQPGLPVSIAPAPGSS
jgi:hypothetical protein